jgi:hypothetical protein
MRPAWLLLAVTTAGLVRAQPARADGNDFSLERLVGPPAMPGSANDPTDPMRQTLYRSLLSEMSVVLAPRPMSPADTLGFSGFQLSVDSSFTKISSGADFWQKGVENVTGGFLPTLTVMARKGIWVPAPSFELGFGGTKLFSSDLFAIQGYLKMGIHEGFHSWPIPSISVRISASHALGTSQVSLTTLGIELNVSKRWTIKKTAKIDPYLGFTSLLTWARSQVLDTTPNLDAYAQGPGSLDLNANVSFPDPELIVRWRLHTGVRFVYTILALTAELSYTLCNDTGADCGLADPTRITDRSGGQTQLSLGGSLIF